MANDVNEPVAELMTYGALADIIGHLPMLLREQRRARRATLRQVADEAGISQPTVWRIESGHDCNTRVLISLLRWMDGAGS